MKNPFSLSYATIVKAYRYIAVVVLYTILVCVVSYGTVMAFYTVNNTWTAPFIVTPTNDKILELTSRIVSSQDALATLTVNQQQIEGSLSDFRKTEQELRTLDGQFQHAILLQKKGDAVDLPDLSPLSTQKHADNQSTSNTMAGAAVINKQIDLDLANGLITKTDAIGSRITIQQYSNYSTDNKLSEVLLRDVMRQKSPEYATTLNNLAKEAELRSAQVQLKIQIQSNEEQLASDKGQIQQLTVAIDTAKASPYFLATQNRVHFAFVPYTNQAAAFVGAPVYDCYLNMILCRQVGIIQRVFSDEEHITHPIFKTDVRGFLIQLELNRVESAKSPTLFLKRKPLLF